MSKSTNGEIKARGGKPAQSLNRTLSGKTDLEGEEERKRKRMEGGELLHRETDSNPTWWGGGGGEGVETIEDKGEVEDAEGKPWKGELSGPNALRGVP